MKSFTLIELLVAVSILAIGIVGVLRSFLGAVTVLDHVHSRLAAVLFLEEKVSLSVIGSELRIEDPYSQGEEPVDLKGRAAVYRYEKVRLEDTVHEGLESVSLSVAWKEGNKIKDEAIVFVQQGKI